MTVVEPARLSRHAPGSPEADSVRHDFPRSPGDINPESLAELLGQGVLQGCRIRRTEVSMIGGGSGYLGQVARIGVEYDHQDHLPATFVAKFGAAEGESRQAAARVGLYRREIGFYKDLAPRLPASAPHAWSVRADPSFAEHVLLLEDVRSISSDQVAGCSVEEAASVLRTVAELHAATWLDSDLADKGWIPRLATPARVANLSGLARRGWPILRELGGDLLDPQSAELGARLADRIPAALEALDAMPWCLLHGDLRLDNILLRPSGLKPVFIDWQGLTVGPAVLDVGYFLVQSLTTHDRRRNLERLLDVYFEALTALGRGAERPPEPTIRVGLRAASVFSLVVACSVPLLDRSGDPRAVVLARAMLERSLSAYFDIASYHGGEAI